MEKYLRSWRQDALNRGQHDSAIYIGDKVLALSNSDSDAFWLAQVHFSNNNFTRALALLSRKDLVSRSTACRYLAAHCYIKQNQFDQALTILGEHNPTDLIRSNNSRRKIQHLNGQTHVTLRNGKTPTSRDRAEEKEEANNVRFEAAMCYLRGLCFAKQNAFDRARDCYKDAVRIDVQCFEAFDQLMKNSLMSPTEELEFLESLDFDSVSSPDPSIAQEAAHLTKMLYTTRLSKYSSPSILSDATETLSTHYNLAQNPDILLSRAEALYTQCRFAEALELTSSILSTSPSTDLTTTSPSIPAHNHLGHAPGVYPLHLACLYETGATNSLFLLAHMLADHAPEEPYTYLAIGVYYLSVSKIAEARRFFSKASLLDPHSAPAWIGFAHTFAAEGEHDQAIAAYSTAARLFQGSHLPQLFLGMQHLALNNMSLAHEYLNAAYTMSTGSAPGSVPSLPANSSSGMPPQGGDPLVLNELGVVFYHQNHLTAAVELFRQALTLAASLRCEPSAWIATRANLGHALRRMGRLPESLREFDECLRVGAGGNSLGFSPFLGGGAGGSATVPTASGVGGYDDRGLVGSLHTSRGLVLLELGRTTDAVTALHEAVRVLGASGGGDAAGGAGAAGTLLSRALEIWALEGRERDHQGFDGGIRSSNSRSSTRSHDLKGKDRLADDTSRRRAVRHEPYQEEWTDEVAHVATPDTAETETLGERVEMELDEEADGLLRRALGRVRPGRSRRPALPTTPEMNASESPATGRSRGMRSGRNQSRQ
ncbi:Tetratricopeptide-like helical [Penicillium alfredii]|uniref:Tetratricopeptide-like helical n=1 Tax=Penicillium alfredii TaxID=1506179 RepID=A0A9W9KFC7_9EURO|nr:Tetratricopeptide-like helical [Penicillium alfredii]KAJ5104400.1 Tetratricopeptide-like helical [Penicillium alfredii]